RRGGGGGEVGAVDVGEVHPALLEHRAAGEHPGATAAALDPGPAVLAEIGAAVLGGEFPADAVLEVEQVGFDSVFVHGFQPPGLSIAPVRKSRISLGLAARPTAPGAMSARRSAK